MRTMHRLFAIVTAAALAFAIFVPKYQGRVCTGQTPHLRLDIGYLVAGR